MIINDILVEFATQGELDERNMGQPRVAAHKPEIVSATDDSKTITVQVRAPDGTTRSMSNSNPAVIQQWLNVKYGLRFPAGIARKFVGMPASMAEGIRDLGYDAQSLIMKLRRDVEEKRLQPTRDAVLMAARELAGDMDFAPELLVQQVLGQRVAEQELDEKSTSQAQFRTMAAAAHNPAFARKVGIDTDVAQEFHGADRDQDYKGLPKKANEAAPRAPDPQNYDSDWDYYNDRDAEEPEDTDADYENMIDEPSDDWFDESKEKVGNMDADAFDDALARMKKLAGAGPLKTVYDPNKRVYKNVPTAQQPAKQPQK
jgi:hypothetical protein